MNANGPLWTPATAYNCLWTRCRCLHPTELACTVKDGAEQPLPKVPGRTPRSTCSIKITILGMELGTHARRGSPPRGSQSSEPSETCFLSAQDQAGADLSRTHRRDPARATGDDALWRGTHLVPPEGESPWTSGCVGRFGDLNRITGVALRLRGRVMLGADAVRGARERDNLTIAEVCADLGISRRTFYEWRAKGRVSRVHHAAERQPPRPPVRITSGGCPPSARQAVTTDTRGQTCMVFYGKVRRFFRDQRRLPCPQSFGHETQPPQLSALGGVD
jgi:predicted DNA-binding transcriptional regulator AlpA